MQDALRGQFTISDELINAFICEFVGGTKNEKVVIFESLENNHFRIEATICEQRIEIVFLLINAGHSRKETRLVAKIENITVKSSRVGNFFAKALSSRALSWFTEWFCSRFLPPGITMKINGDRLEVEMRECLCNSSVGEIIVPVIGRIIDKVMVTSAIVVQGGVAVEVVIGHEHEK